MQHRIILGAASIALLGSGAFAHPQMPRPQGDKPTPQTDRPVDRAAPNNAMVGNMGCHKASEIVGADIKNAQGQDIGEVQDLIVDPSTGRLDYAVVSIAKRGKDEWYAIPFHNLKTPAAMDHDDFADRDGKRDAQGGNERHALRKPEFVLDLDQAKLESAPGFAKDKWPDLNAPNWRTDLERFYGVRRTVESSRNGDVIEQQRAVRISKVLDQDVRTVAGENLGGVEELVIDPRNARIAYLVVSTGGFLGMGEKMHAIPWEAARAKSRNEKDSDDLIVNVTKDRLQKAPEFKKNDWARMSEATYLSELYTYYGARPYWTETDMNKRDTRSAKPLGKDVDDKGNDPR